MPVWTEEQHAAIYDRNPTILVSAAAGSGKTAVLIERIYSLITQDQMDVERMLVVTFTRAAAAEMRERLHRRLQQDADSNVHVRKQLDKLDRASISTLHVFCGQVIKEFFNTIALDPTARLFEGGERAALFDKAMAAAFEEAYEKGSLSFISLAQRYTDGQMVQMVETLYAFLMAQANPWQWLDEKVKNLPDKETFQNHSWFLSLCHDLFVQAQGAYDLAEDMELWCRQENAIAYCSEISQADKRISDHLLESLHNQTSDLWDFSSSVEFLPLTKVPRKKTVEEAAWYEVYQEKRKKWKDLLQKKILPQLPVDLDKTAADIENTALPLEGLQEITLLFHQHFDQLKKEKNVYDFYDLEHKTLEVLQNSYARQVLKERFDAVFVDEYQDTSGIQEAILQALHEDNMIFMVGDVKQSIYRFRLADPTLFLEKQQSFSSNRESQKRKIDLQRNFRSAGDILEGVNQVFTHVMDERVTEIHYDDHARLIPGLEAKSPAPIHLTVNLAPFEKTGEQKDTDLSKTEQEALLIAEHLKNLYGTPVQDKDIIRTITWKDMVVLLPKAKGVAKPVAAIFQEKGIPVYSDADEEYFSLPEIDTIMAFLQMIDNPLQDLPLLRVLKASPFLFTEQELTEIRLHMPQKNAFFYESFFSACAENTPLGHRCAKTAEQIKLWRKQAMLIPLDQFIWQLLWETHLYTLCGAMPAGDIRQGNLRLLCQKAYDFSQSQKGSLHDFLLLSFSLSSSGDSQTAKILGEGEDVVRLMTIHKSKGLEFPVVAVMGLGSNMHLSGGKGELLLHKELGLALNYMNVPARITRKTFGQNAISLRKKMEEKAERARLLYVAMTRAKQHLFLIGTPTRESDLNSWSLSSGPYAVWEATSMLDWICQSVFLMPEGAELQQAVKEKLTFSPSYTQGMNPWKIKVSYDFPKSGVEKIVDIHKEIDRLLARAVKGQSSYGFYDPPEAVRPPVKTSVTSLIKKGVFKNQFVLQEEETALTKGIGETLVAPLQLSPLPAVPDFMITDEKAVLTPAQRGTVTHKALGLIPLGTIRGLSSKDLEEELILQVQFLFEKGVFTKEEKEVLSIPWLTGFFQSPLGQRLLKSQEVHREWPFIYKLPQAQTLVQGVIDCCFIEDGVFVLVDYKTDYVTDYNIVKQRYQGQISLYKEALEKITKIPVAQSYLYLLRKGESLLLQEVSDGLTT